MAPAGDLAERVGTTFGVRLAEGYGCAEAGLIAGSARATGTMDRVFTAGVATVDERGTPTPPGTPGEIVGWGAAVSGSYIGDPEATAASFDAEGRFRTGDVGALDEAGRLRLVGRTKDVINRGGEKIAPAEIDAALMAHPAVAEAAAFPIPDSRLGEEIAVAVVVQAGSDATERDLRRHAAKLLAPAKVPRRVWIVAALLRTGSGKVRRAELARMVEGRA